MKKASRLLSSVPVFALALSLIPHAASAATVPAIAAFDEAFSKVNDYTVTVRAHEVKGERTQDRTYHYFFKRPSLAKTDIVSGDGAGSGGVWIGTDQVHGHLKVGPFTFGRKVGLHDSQATSLRGYTLPEGLIQNEVAKFTQLKGELTERGGPVIDGTPTEEVDLKLADPAEAGSVTRMAIYLSKQTSFPVRQIRWDGDKIVADETFSDLKTNVGLSQNDFPF